MTVRFAPTPLTAWPALDPAALAGARPSGIDAALRDACVTTDEARVHLDKLLTPDTLCVTTGQQPGLLLGPLFTVYKAATAIALARDLEATLGRTVVPVFWVAGDDHDFAEANHVYVLGMTNTIERVALRSRAAAAPLTPLYQEPLGQEITTAIDRVLQATPDTEFKADVASWLERHYAPDRDFAGAFADALAELFAPHGLVVFRPTHPAAKRAMAPHLLRALAVAADLDDALGARAAELVRRGDVAPVRVGDGATLVMLEGRVGRDRLVLQNGRYAGRRSGDTWSLDELQFLADREPERLSPNVLLRPVVEAALLPTVAYVAGPGELDYLPQAAPVYQALDVAPQVAVPRWSGRLIEQRVDKVLQKYQLLPEQLDLAEGQLEASLARDAMPPAAAEALRALRQAIASEYERLQTAAVRVDPTLKKPVQSARNAALGGAADLEKRIVSHLKKRNEIVTQQLAKARHSLYPLGKPQERVLNVVTYLVRYGPTFLNHLIDACARDLPTLESRQRTP